MIGGLEQSSATILLRCRRRISLRSVAPTLPGQELCALPAVGQCSDPAHQMINGGVYHGQDSGTELLAVEVVPYHINLSVQGIHNRPCHG